MRVLVIAQYFPPDMGGGATRALNAAQGLSIAGCDVTVIAAFPHYPTGNVPKNCRMRPFTVDRIGDLKLFRTFVPPIASVGYFRRLILFISFIFSSLFVYFHIGPVDVVWVANPNVTAMMPGIVYSRMKKCPVVQNVDDLWPEVLFEIGVKKQSIFGRIATLFAKIAYRFADALTPISPAYTEVIARNYSFPRSKIFEVKAGVDLSRFPKSDPKLPHKGPFRVLYIGAFSPAYDFEQVFYAARLLQNENIEFVIQGGGELSHRLLEQSKVMKLNSLHIVNKIVDRKEVARLLSTANALLLPLGGSEMVEYGISSKLYEYQASGRPILCISKGQPGRYIKDTNSGIVIPSGDSKALAEAILFLRANEEEANRMGRNGRRFVEQNLSIEHIGKQLRQVLQTVREAKKKADS